VINGAVGPNDNIVNVTAVRTGSMTHSYNSDSAFLQPAFEQVGQQLNIQLPIDTSALIPGYWMIFAWNDQGVPSRAAVVHVALV
jgi:hypothetical protein